MPTQTLSSLTGLQPSSPSSRHKLYILLIVLVWAVIYAGSLFQPPLMDDADTVHGEAAREMLERGDWVTLKINGGFRYLEKAPLMYWLVAASYKLFGVHDWSARLPIALGMLALLLVVYRVGRRFYSDEGGLYAALALGTGFGPFIYTRFMIPEMLVALWLAIGFDFFLTSLEQSERGEQPSLLVCWGLAATMALNVLTKGLIGLVFPYRHDLSLFCCSREICATCCGFVCFQAFWFFWRSPLHGICWQGFAIRHREKRVVSSGFTLSMNIFCAS